MQIKVIALGLMLPVSALAVPQVVDVTPGGTSSRDVTAQDEARRPVNAPIPTNAAQTLRNDLRSLNAAYSNLASNVQTNPAFNAQQKLVLRDLGQLLRDFAGVILKYYRDE